MIHQFETVIVGSGGADLSSIMRPWKPVNGNKQPCCQSYILFAAIKVLLREASAARAGEFRRKSARMVRL